MTKKKIIYLPIEELPARYTQMMNASIYPKVDISLYPKIEIDKEIKITIEFEKFYIYF